MEAVQQKDSHIRGALAWSHVKRLSSAPEIAWLRKLFLWDQQPRYFQDIDQPLDLANPTFCSVYLSIWIRMHHLSLQPISKQHRDNNRSYDPSGISKHLAGSATWKRNASRSILSLRTTFTRKARLKIRIKIIRTTQKRRPAGGFVCSKSLFFDYQSRMLTQILRRSRYSNRTDLLLLPVVN